MSLSWVVNPRPFLADLGACACALIYCCATCHYMTIFTSIYPCPLHHLAVGKQCAVKLKWGMEYRGILVSTDSYMNFQLAKAEEFLDGEPAGTLGEILIRCNNVLYVRRVDEGKDSAAAGSGMVEA